MVCIDVTMLMRFVCLQLAMQAHGKLKPIASKAEHATANEVLARALIMKDVPMNFLSSPDFQAYVHKVSAGRFKAPSRFTIVDCFDALGSRIAAKVRMQLEGSTFISIEEDSWTRRTKHFSAVTTGGPGQSLFVAAYQNTASDNAVNSADAIHRCALSDYAADACSFMTCIACCA